MPDNQDPQTDAEFCVALGYEMQKTDEPELQFFGSATTDHVFHDLPVDLDDTTKEEPVPTWGECFNW